MSDKEKLKIPNKANFVNFTDAFAKISDTFIITIGNSVLSVVATSPDNTCIAYGEYLIPTDIQSQRLNIPDSKRFVRALEVIPSADIEFKVNSNNVEYRDSNTKFKYHLFEDGFLKDPPISLKKLKELEYDIKFTLSKSVIQSILKNSTLVSPVNKIYLYTENGNLHGDITDKATHNVDSFCMTLLQNVDFSFSDIIINLDNLRLITLLSKDVIVEINTKYGFVRITIPVEDNKITYTITTQSQ
jgi:hypothetical protein